MSMTLRPINRKLAPVSGDILADDPDELAFIHSTFCSCALPYRSPPELVYQRSTGRASLMVASGWRKDEKTDELVPTGIPYGPKPRLVLLHAFTEAVRRQSREIPIAETLSGYLRDDLGANTDTRTLRTYREQLRRLAKASVTIEWSDPASGRHVIQDAKPFSRLELWGEADANQRELWPSAITLGADFFDSLIEHAVPLDQRAIAALKHNARALDLYAWLAHRLHRIKAPTFISWQALAGQFGGASQIDTDTRMTSFKGKLMDALVQAHQVYPKARIEKVRGGINLMKSPPPVKTITVQGSDLLT